MAANVAAIMLTLAFKMSLRDLMLIYWLQSMAIGVTHFFRILSLDRFTTGGVYLDNQAAQETLGSKIRAAGFFWMHYGAFHVIYFLFIVFIDQGGALGSPGKYLVCALAFFVSEVASMRETVRRDAAGRPSLGLLMVMPYARVVPMLAVVGSGAYFSGGGNSALLLFGILKTVVDVLMQLAENYLYERGREDAG